MFVRNLSPFAPVLARDFLTDDFGALCISVEVALEATEDDSGWRLFPPPPPLPTDPPDIRRNLFWRGCSVTAYGEVTGPERPPYFRVVRLTVGSVVRQLVVFGPRTWHRRLTGEIAAGEPAPFQSTPQTWSRAYGGTLDLSPGFLPGTQLPHPGGRVAYDLNPHGLGFWIGDRDVEGVALPNIENPEHLVKQPGERAIPAGFAPCGDLAGLRMQATDMKAPLDMSMALSAAIDGALRLQHHAPGALIFDQVSAGDVIAIEGVGATMRFTVPASPVRVMIRRGSAAEETSSRVRSVHVDAERKVVRIVYGHGHRFRSRRPPRRIDITPVEAA
jgi:hypothetical protein